MTDSDSVPGLVKPEASSPRVGRLVLKRFLVFFLLLMVVFFGVSLPIYVQYKEGVQEQLLANEEISVASAVQMFQKEMYEQLHMLDLIIQTQALREYLAEGTVEQRIHVEKLFESIATSFHRFDQIRLLDNTGLEKIRVNLVEGKGQPVAQKDLQSKAQRYYFKAVQNMQPGQIYISTMDLNVENGVIEEPYKPTLRFSTPLKDAQGNQAGVLVINYLAKGMLERFRQFMSRRVDQQGMLLDSQGYWLSNHERSNEWGADLGRPEHGFSQLFPNAWPTVAANESGVLETKKGVFRYQSVEPLNFLDNQPAHFRMEHYPLITPESYANTNWKLVVFLPRDVIDSHSFLNQPLGRTLLALFILMIASLALLGAYLAVHRQLRLQKEQEIRALLERQASIDALTGIRNRRSFYELGEGELKRAFRYNEPLTALMVDADYFKKINDTYGHLAGDLCLKRVAKATYDTVKRTSDLVCRYGGEELAIILPNTDHYGAMNIAERIRDEIERLNIDFAGQTIRLTASLGVASFTPDTNTTSDLLIALADKALYQAKDEGRNCTRSNTVAAV